MTRVHTRSRAGEARRSRWAPAAIALAALAGPATTPPALARQDAPPPAPAAPPTAPAPELAPFDGRLVSEIRLEGLKEAQPQFVRNQLRTQEGRPFGAQTVSEDIQRLYRTGAFRRASARVEALADGSVAVIYHLEEAKIIEDVQVVGNRSLTDQQLAGVVSLLKGTPVDEFQLGRTRRAIEDLYRDKGYYLARVTIDMEELDRSGVILFRIREGERIKVTDIRFRGNRVFDGREIRPVLKTKTAGWFETGPLDNNTLDEDAVSVVRFYRDRGYLDARADKEVTPSPNGKEAIVTFIIDEGPRYTLRRVTVRNAAGEGPLTLSIEQIAGLMELKAGDVLGETALRNSIEQVQQAYFHFGHADATVRAQELRDLNSPQVDLLLTIAEGRRFRTGEVIIQGDTLTRQNVIRRQVQVRPDRPLDRAALEDSRRRLETERLFAPGSVKTTIQPEQPDAPGYRDVLVEVEEQNTGQFSIGAAISSDSGVVGTIGLNQRNFDVLDVPETWSDLLAGRAFRGGGQVLDLTVAPGFEVQTYSINLTDPYLFDTDTSLGVGLSYRTREYDDHDEGRFGGRVRFGRRFGDRWTGGIAFRGENVNVSDIDSDAPVDLFEVEGDSLVLGLGVSLTRTTVPPADRLYPSRGARTELSAEQVFGDFTFTKLSAEHSLWLGIYEDFLGRKSVLALRTSAAFIPQEGESPLFERYFLGGRSFRGFDYRGVSPRGIRNDTGTLGDDPIGGDWAFFAGLEFQQPIYGNIDGRPIFSVVAFLDTGTVQEDFGFDEYRVAIGFGIRLLLPISPVPLAFDFGFPLVEQDGDETQLFSFSVDLPF